MANQASRLVNDLSYLPAILGRMGLSVAEAQDELNHGYVQAVAEIAKLLGDLLPKSNIPGQLDPQIATLLLQLAPSRYQFSETTFDFSADLAESFNAGGSAELRLGTKAVALNAAIAVDFGYDYRAAARITCKLHALPAGKDITSELLTRVATIDSTQLKDLPNVSPARTNTSTLLESLGKSLKKPEEKDDSAPSGN
mgnify:FL=1